MFNSEARGFSDLFSPLYGQIVILFCIKIGWDELIWQHQLLVSSKVCSLREN